MAGGPSLVDTARTLGVAPRSLQRRLAGLDTSFEALLDDWRRAEARALLAGTTEPVDAIARALGYGHAAYFTRTFHHWEETTPGAFRRARLARNGN
ncbi:MAG: helix-turn-helix transcriptional regulator [Amaricoccus sp.]|uniref:helix-turn-helix transcriptional regulator n=1 Tax=Amaricoccus sp. TaxID=1872485 RepID=UPI0039E6A851